MAPGGAVSSDVDVIKKVGPVLLGRAQTSSMVAGGAQGPDHGKSSPKLDAAKRRSIFGEARAQLQSQITEHRRLLSAMGPLEKFAASAQAVLKATHVFVLKSNVVERWKEARAEQKLELSNGARVNEAAGANAEFKVDFLLEEFQTMSGLIPSLAEYNTLKQIAQQCISMVQTSISTLRRLHDSSSKDVHDSIQLRALFDEQSVRAQELWDKIKDDISRIKKLLEKGEDLEDQSTQPLHKTASTPFVKIVEHSLQSLGLIREACGKASPTNSRCSDNAAFNEQISAALALTGDSYQRLVDWGESLDMLRGASGTRNKRSERDNECAQTQATVVLESELDKNIDKELDGHLLTFLQECEKGPQPPTAPPHEAREVKQQAMSTQGELESLEAIIAPTRNAVEPGHAELPISEEPPVTESPSSVSGHSDCLADCALGQAQSSGTLRIATPETPPEPPPKIRASIVTAHCPPSRFTSNASKCSGEEHQGTVSELPVTVSHRGRRFSEPELIKGVSPPLGIARTNRARRASEPDAVSDHVHSTMMEHEIDVEMVAQLDYMSSQQQYCSEDKMYKLMVRGRSMSVSSLPPVANTGAPSCPEFDDDDEDSSSRSSTSSRPTVSRDHRRSPNAAAAPKRRPSISSTSSRPPYRETTDDHHQRHSITRLPTHHALHSTLEEVMLKRMSKWHVVKESFHLPSLVGRAGLQKHVK